MPAPEAANALDHVVVVLFENRSLDNVLGHLYGLEDGKNFDGVVGKNLSNPIPDWAEHGAERKVVPYTVATDMDAPNPDSGEEWFHTNTQLFNVLDEQNRFKIGEGASEPWNAPQPGATPTMDGFVTDYISTFTAEMGRQPTYDEYAQIMTGYTPEQLPVLNGLAREFGVFDHWFSEVPSQTFMNRSFWTAATSSGLVVNSPVRKWFRKNDAETIFERLEQHGKTWKIYVMEPMPLSFHGIIHFSRLKTRLATNVVPFAEFERDAAAGTLPNFSLIEPNFISGHGDYHPAFGRSLGATIDADSLDPPSSALAGEAFLQRIFDTYRSGTSESGSNVWNTALLDRVGRAGGNLRPRSARTRSSARPGRACRRARLRVRPLRLPRSRDSRLSLGSAGGRLQRRVPAHLADRHPAEGLGAGRAADPARRGRTHLRRPLHSRRAARPGNMGDRHRAPRARVAPRRRGSRQGSQRPRQEHGTRNHRTRQGDRAQAPISARRPGSRSHRSNHPRRVQARRLALLPASLARRGSRRRSRAEQLAARDPDARAGGSDRRGRTEHRPAQSVGRLHSREGYHERCQDKAAERERADRCAAPPVQLSLGSDPPPLVERPGRQLTGEEEQDGHERRARVDSVSGPGNRCDVGRAGQEERRAESASVEEQRGDEQQRANDGARDEAGDRRRRTRKRVGEDASIGSGRSDGERYAGRARCLNAFTSSRGTASGSSSRQVTTGTPTCS